MKKMAQDLRVFIFIFCYYFFFMVSWYMSITPCTYQEFLVLIHAPSPFKRFLKSCTRDTLWVFGFNWLLRLCFCPADFSFYFLFLFLVQLALVDFSIVNSVFVHCSRTHKFYFLATFFYQKWVTWYYLHI